MDDFKRFLGTVTIDYLRAAAEEVFDVYSVPARVRKESLERLARARLTESRQRLIFNYRLAFESRG
jgi:hypothetical protein